MYPTLEEIKKMAQSGEYKRIPVCRELYADRYTPVEVMRTLRRASRHCYLLESASQTEVWGRYSFLGYEPEMEITCTDGIMRIRYTGGQKEEITKKVVHPGDTLREIIQEYKSPVMEDMPPFTGGLVGYFSYDYIKYSEPKLKLGEHEDPDFRDMDLMLFDQVIAFDHYRQKVLLITGVLLDQLEESYRKAEEKLEEMAELIRNGEKEQFASLKLESEISPQFPKEKYCEMVEKARHYIKEGDIFQVVLSNPMRAKAEGSLFDTYRVLRATNPSPYMFYFSSDDIEIAGASPETLVKLENRKLTTFPLAGTRPRGKTKEEDQELEAGLLKDEKELAEHNMLVDLGRNDIGKISKIGSVKVEKYLSVEHFSQVMHLGSTVAGEIRDDRDAVDAVDSILPAGTLSGAPKFRACQIIEELEQSKRGIYGGAIGYLDFAGNLDTCIAIRLVYKKNGEICIRSGAGIVADSVPQKEFEECCNKARAVVLAIQKAQEGLE
ncbi:anthranilate synthase component I [Blautia sp. HCP28S3_G10]|uniref:anthranilate synthase component I n=1 Tax=Blautia sp. HCP28S3_G10 TaxID=3438908 RepID=UPI003F8B17DE